MSKILVFGHKNPDNDAIMSAVVYSQLASVLDPANEYVACRLGEMPGESAACLRSTASPSLSSSRRSSLPTRRSRSS